MKSIITSYELVPEGWFPYNQIYDCLLETPVTKPHDPSTSIPGSGWRGWAPRTSLRVHVPGSLYTLAVTYARKV